MKSERITGYDFARAFAVFGMVVVNFKIVMCLNKDASGWLSAAAGLLEGRAAALFVILAGAGMTLYHKGRKISSTDQNSSGVKHLFLVRAVLLFITGLVYIPLWPADILHFYGVYIGVGVFFLFSTDRTLLILSLFFTFGFVILLLIFNYETGWNWETLNYKDFWTLNGMVRHIFFNGFHPVFPWISFLFFGIWLGRQDLSLPEKRRLYLIRAAVILIITETASRLLKFYFTQNIQHDMVSDINALIGTHPIPPMPFYVFSAGSSAVIFIVLSIILTERFKKSLLLKPFIFTGQISLTLYVAHVIIGMGFLETIGRLENQTISFSIMSALVFNLLSVIFASFVKSKFRTGPLEWLFRKISGAVFSAKLYSSDKE